MREEPLIWRAPSSRRCHLQQLRNRRRSAATPAPHHPCLHSRLLQPFGDCDCTAAGPLLLLPCIFNRIGLRLRRQQLTSEVGVPWEPAYSSVTAKVQRTRPESGFKGDDHREAVQPRCVPPQLGKLLKQRQQIMGAGKGTRHGIRVTAHTGRGKRGRFLIP